MDSNRQGGKSLLKKDYPFDLHNIEEEENNSVLNLSGSDKEKDLLRVIIKDQSKKSTIKSEKSHEEANNKHDKEIYLNTDEERQFNQRFVGSRVILRSERGYSNFSEISPKTDFEYKMPKIESSTSEEEQESEESLNLVDDKVEYVNSLKQMQRTRSRVSFYEGRPKDEEEILKLECPLYRCSRNTIVTQNFLTQASIKSDNKTKSRNLTSSNILTKGKLPHDHNTGSRAKLKRKNAIVDLKLAETLELRTFNSLFMTILQIINCIIRYTLIQFPFCIKTLGLIYGPLIITIIGSMSIFSVYMLIKVKECTGEASYSAFAYKWWGLKGKIFILVLNCLSSFGSCLSYVIIFLKVIPKLVNIGMGDSLLSDKKILSIILGLLLLIYCYQKDISGIKSAAFWGVLGIIIYTLLNIVNLLYSSWIEDITEDRHITYFSLSLGKLDIYSCIACIILSFSFHTYAFSIYECLDDPCPKKMIVTSSIGIFISILIYLLVGTIGYIIYGNLITDSILDSMGYSNLAILGNIAFVVNVVMSFPLTFSALKHYFMYLLQIIVTLIINSCCSKKKSEEELLEKNQHDVTHTSSIKNIHKEDSDESINNNQLHHNELKNKKHHHTNHAKAHAHMEMVHIPDYVEYMLIFFIFLLIFYTANIFPNMKTIFGFLGATTANLFSFILPALYYIKFSDNNLWITGLAGLIVCLTSNIISRVGGKDH